MVFLAAPFPFPVPVPVRKIDAAGLEGNNMDQSLGRMKLFNARRKFKSAIQTVIASRKFTEGILAMSTP